LEGAAIKTLRKYRPPQVMYAVADEDADLARSELARHQVCFQ
jgi:hypothetical protein